MKKLLALVLAACLLMTVVPAFATVADTVAASENLTHDELVEKAKAEEGTFIVYGNTSRISTAAENFSKLYDIPFESNNLKDAEIYTKLESEIKGSAKGADMVMIQDGAQLTYAIEDGWVVNYVPASVKDTVKALQVGGVTPSEETVKDGSYAIQRPFVLVTKEGVALSETAQAFVDFAFSADAAPIITASGVVPA